MMIKKTVYKKDVYSPRFQNPVLYIGFNSTKQATWLNSVSVLAGFNGTILIDTVSKAKTFLDKPHKDIANVCIVNARYDYKTRFSDQVPIDEIPFCTLDGLSYYKKRKGPGDGFFQGFKFISKYANNYSDITFAVYGPPYDGIPLQAKEMKLDFIPALSDNVYVPFTVLEYLRNKNNILFDR